MHCPGWTGAAKAPTGSAKASAGWKLARELRDETGVVFAASFPALDSLVEELARAMAARLCSAQADSRRLWLDELRQLVSGQHAAAAAAAESGGGSSGAASDEVVRLSELSAWLAQQQVAASDAATDSTAGSYEFNRKLLFKLLVMANSQLAEIIQARGPNLHINAACAGTTAAIALGCDWLRSGRCRRVIIISADNPSSEHLLPWVGIGFLALGAACTKAKVAEAALPFDKRRCGMLLGAGAVGLVLETDLAASGPVGRPARALMAPVTVLGVRHANSAYHASAIGVKHATEVLDDLLRDVDRVHRLPRAELVRSLLYVSHETCTHARNGGCAGAEVRRGCLPACLPAYSPPRRRFRLCPPHVLPAAGDRPTRRLRRRPAQDPHRQLEGHHRPRDGRVLRGRALRRLADLWPRTADRPPPGGRPSARPVEAQPWRPARLQVRAALRRRLRLANHVCALCPARRTLTRNGDFRWLVARRDT